MDRNNQGVRRNSISVPGFVNENPNTNRSYIERNTTQYNGYNNGSNRRTEPSSGYTSARSSDANRIPKSSSQKTTIHTAQKITEHNSASRNSTAQRNGTGNNQTQKNSVKNRKRRRRNKVIKRILFSMMMIVAIVAGHFIAKVQTALNTMDRSSGIDLSSIQVDAANVSTDDRIINILLVGADKREKWQEAGRSDSVMIATLDLKHKRLKITSLMRDMYVPIPDHGEAKFNAAYSYGGVELLYQTIATNFGIKADGYAVVDFAAFKTVINTIGGVDIELTEDEYEYLTTAYKKGSVLELQPGLNKMDGNQALAYTRIRQDANGDFGRTQRQRKVLQAIFKEAKAMSVSDVMELAEEILPNVQTDLSNAEIISYLTSVLTMGTTEIDQKRIPIDDSFTQDRINNQAVLIPDMAVNTNALQEFIYQYDGEQSNNVD